jgi:hypothetical protein
MKKQEICLDQVLNDGDAFLVKLPNSFKEYLAYPEYFSLESDTEQKLGDVEEMVAIPDDDVEADKEEENPEFDMFARTEEKIHPVKKITGRMTLRLPKKKLMKKGEI